MYDYSDGAPTNQYPKDKVPDTMGYIPIAVTDDGDVLCEACVLDPTNPVHEHDYAKHSSGGDGWGVIAWTHSGEVEGPEHCSHCHKELAS